MQEIKSITRSLFEAFNNRDFQKLVDISSPSLEWIDQATGIKLTGSDALKKWSQSWLTAFPDGKVEVVNHFASNDQVCTEYIGRGRHTGVLTIGQKKIPASNKTVEFKMCNVVRMMDGKITSGHVYFDMLALSRQIGIEPSAIAA
jgi:steroid delta-isomerase-like uncharacterized protein